MALPSGQISFEDINVELGFSPSALIGIGDSTVRTLFGVSSGQISFQDGWGKSGVSYWASKLVPNSGGTRLPITYVTKPSIASDGSIYIAGALSDGSASPRGFVLYVTAGGQFGWLKKLVPLSGYEFNTSVYGIMGGQGGSAFGVVHGEYNPGTYGYIPYAWTVWVNGGPPGGILMSTKIQSTIGNSYTIATQKIASDNGSYSCIIPFTGSIGNGAVRSTIYSSGGFTSLTYGGANALPQGVYSGHNANTRWTFGSDHTVSTGWPTIANGSLYAVTSGGSISAQKFRDASDGTTAIWSTVGLSGLELHATAASANVLYIVGSTGGGQNHHLIALHTANGTVKWSKAVPGQATYNTKFVPSVSTWSNATVAGVSMIMMANNIVSNSTHGTTVATFDEANGQLLTTKTFHYANSQIKLSPIELRTNGLSDKTILILAHNSAQGVADGNTASPLIVKFSTWSNADITAANGAILIDSQSLYINAVANAAAFTNGNWTMSTTSAPSFANSYLDTNNNAVNNSSIDQAFSNAAVANTYKQIL